MARGLGRIGIPAIPEEAGKILRGERRTAALDQRAESALPAHRVVVPCGRGGELAGLEARRLVVVRTDDVIGARRGADHSAVWPGELDTQPCPLARAAHGETPARGAPPLARDPHHVLEGLGAAGDVVDDVDDHRAAPCHVAVPARVRSDHDAGLVDHGDDRRVSAARGEEAVTLAGIGHAHDERGRAVPDADAGEIEVAGEQELAVGGGRAPRDRGRARGDRGHRRAAL